MLAKFFKFKEHNTDLRTEVLAGLTTFMTMAYIIFVNPSILAKADIPFAATAAATCIAAALPTIMMGLTANYPFALAAGMGLNGVVVGLVLNQHLTWQQAMGIIVLEGVIIGTLVLIGLREAVMHAIPMNLKRAIGGGIGLFIALLGLQNAGWVVQGKEGVLLAPGTFHSVPALIAAAGLVITVVLLAARVKGAFLLGILATTIIALIFGIAKPPTGVYAMPDFSTFGHASILSVLKPAFIAMIFSFLMVDFFDTMGTVIGIGDQAGFTDPNGRLPRIKNVLLVDSFAAAWGGLCGSSSSTTYIESAAGVGAGGRTGLTSVVVGICFLLALFFSPLIGVVPGVATAPVLMVVGFLMMSVVRGIDFGNIEESFPAFLCLITMPLTMSIAHGIGYGFIAFTLIKVLRGKFKDIHPLMAIISLVFAISFALQA